jgi:hypothetical protein
VDRLTFGIRTIEFTNCGLGINMTLVCDEGNAFRTAGTIIPQVQ